MYLIQQTNARWAQMASSLGYIHPGDIAYQLGNGMRKDTVLKAKRQEADEDKPDHRYSA